LLLQHAAISTLEEKLDVQMSRPKWRERINGIAQEIDIEPGRLWRRFAGASDLTPAENQRVAVMLATLLQRPQHAQDQLMAAVLAETFGIHLLPDEVREGLAVRSDRKADTAASNRRQLTQQPK
jgi:hypothetical protein